MLDENNTQVVVKMLEDDPSLVEIKHLINEIKNLTYLEKHPHIIELFGACTSKLNIGKILAFYELCPLGSLKTYLKGFQSSRNSVDIEMGEEVDECFNEDGGAEAKILSEDLARWSQEIVSGLDYLTSRRVIVIDIATRNVLLTADKRVKITEFGFSRRVSESNDKYFLPVQMPLPWRWMAPESLLRLEFSEKSDVWTFGVTLWEMYSLGDLPFHGVSWDETFPNMLEKGLRLRLPCYGYGSDNIYSVMCECWATDPKMRPTFSELKHLLKLK